MFKKEIKLKIGPAIGSYESKPKKLIDLLTSSLSFSNEVLEMSLIGLEKVKNILDPRVIKLVKRFKYRSVHFPAIINKGEDKKFLSYPKDVAQFEGQFRIIDQFIKATKPHTLLFHPDLINDFIWLSKKYGGLVAFENMDDGKKIGRTAKDLVEIFRKCPKAKWVFDINHLYTNDHSMKSADEFWQLFKGRLGHYHISSLGDFHDCFYITHEDAILRGIKDVNYPMVHEGHALEKGIWAKEVEYIKKRVVF
jgi:hypothetical protein